MPTVLREGGFSIRIYLDDHPPPHVHVVSASGTAKIRIDGDERRPQLVSVVGMSRVEAARALRLVVEHNHYASGAGKTSMNELEPIEAEIAKAERAGERAARSEPRACAARFDAEAGRLVVDLTNGATFLVPAGLVQGLEGAEASAVSAVEITPGGEALHWEVLDVDISVPGLLNGVFGTRAWMRELGRRGGLSKSPRKGDAARQNGRKGGRPRVEAMGS